MIILAITILAIILMIVLICLGFQKYKDKIKEETCPHTHETFIIQNHKHEPDWVGKEIAKRLSLLARKGTTLVNYMYEHNLPNKVVAERLYNRWNKIRNNPKGLREIGKNEKSAAYTVNKGDELRICIRNPNSENLFEDENTSMFVLLHEISHLGVNSWGHGVPFKRLFAYITKLAVQLELYHYIDYSSSPTNYCSVDITNSAY